MFTTSTRKQIALGCDVLNLLDVFETFELCPATEHGEAIKRDSGLSVRHGGSISGVGGFRCFKATPKAEVLEYIDDQTAAPAGTGGATRATAPKAPTPCAGMPCTLRRRTGAPGAARRRAPRIAAGCALASPTISLTTSTTVGESTKLETSLNLNGMEANMKITLRIAGKTHPARLPCAECEYVEVPGVDCPTCADLVALVDFDGQVMALAPASSLVEARADFPGCVEQSYSGPLQARLPNPEIRHASYEGAAECTRCRCGVGHMTVKVETLFGIEEDSRVLNGRCRVY